MNPQAKYCGEMLRRQRVHRGWSQARVAEQVGTTAAVVSKWERGISLPVPYYREKLCALYGLSAEDLGFVPPPSEQQEVASRAPSPAQPESTPGVAALPPITSSPLPVVALTEAEASQFTAISSSSISLSPTGPQYVVVVVPKIATIQSEERREMNEGRRETIQGIGTVVSGAFLPYQDILHLDAMERLAKVRAKPSSLDAETLHGLKATTENYWHLFAHGSVAYPSLLEATTGHFKLVVQFLQGSLLPSTRSALSAIASETAQLAAVLSGHMLHLHDQAQDHYNLALVAAQEANNDALYATALGRIGCLMSDIRRPEEAIVYLEEAQRIAAQCAAFTLVCCSAAEQAEEYADVAVQSNAQQPDDRNCLRALETVNTWVERIQPGEETFGVLFNTCRQTAYHGSCYMRLRQHHLARPALLSGLTMPKPLARYTWGILLDLATTSMQEQEIEQACNYVHQLLDITLPIRAMGPLHRVRSLRQQLEPWAMVEAVRNLDERLHAV